MKWFKSKNSLTKYLKDSKAKSNESFWSLSKHTSYHIWNFYVNEEIYLTDQKI